MKIAVVLAALVICGCLSVAKPYPAYGPDEDVRIIATGERGRVVGVSGPKRADYWEYSVAHSGRISLFRDEELCRWEDQRNE